MCKAALATSDWIVVKDWELNQRTWTPTRQVLEQYQKEQTQLAPVSPPKLMVLCGADLLESFLVPNLWADDDKEFILGSCGVVCMERAGLDAHALIQQNRIFFKHRHNIILVPGYAENNVSSTKVRELVARGSSTRTLLLDGVRSIIADKGFYSYNADVAPPQSSLEGQDVPKAIILGHWSCNPVTNMHLWLFENIRDFLHRNINVNVVQAVLSPEWKTKEDGVPGTQRVQLAEAAVLGSDWMVVDGHEASQEVKPNFLDVIARIKEERKVSKVYCTVRRDLIARMGECVGTEHAAWVKELLEASSMVVVAKASDDIPKMIFENDLLYEYRSKFVIVSPDVLLNFPSSQARRYVRRSFSLKYLVPDEAISVIKHANLYQ